MASGDLTCTAVGLYNLSSLSGAANFSAAISALNLPAATDFLYVIPVADGKQVMVMKVVRAA